MLNKIKILALFALLAAGNVFANDTTFKAKEPRSGRVLVIGNLSYKRPIDIKGREKAFREMGSKNLSKRVADFSYQPDFKEKVYDTQTESIDGYFYQEVKVPKDRKLHLESFTVSMFAKSSQWYKFCLPAGFEITLPEDAQYIYIGTFEYDLDYALCPVGFEHLDDYEYAQKLLNRDIGKEVKLYRAPLKLEEKAEK